MIKNGLKDFNYDYKEHKKYVSNKYIYDINGLIRRKWSLYLHSMITQKNDLKNNHEQKLSLRR